MLSLRRMPGYTGCALFAALLAPATSLAQSSVLRTTLPPITVTAQKEPEDPLEVPVSVSAVTGDTLDSAGIVSISDAAAYAPNTYFNEFTARKLSNARFRGIGSEPEQLRRHHLHRRRPAAQRELVEHRVGGHRSDRLRPRPAQRALRAQRARRRDQHHQPAAVAPELVGRRGRAVRQLRVGGRPRFRIGTARHRQARARRRRRLHAARRLHRQRRDRQRHRLAFGRVRQGAAALAPGRPLGSPRDVHLRTRARRRLRAAGRRGAARQPVPCPAQPRRVHAPRHHRADLPADAQRLARRFLRRHRRLEVEDERSHRSRLHRVSARDAQQR